MMTQPERTPQMPSVRRPVEDAALARLARRRACWTAPRATPLQLRQRLTVARHTRDEHGLWLLQRHMEAA